jgi:hypothetical protein
MIWVFENVLISIARHRSAGLPKTGRPAHWPPFSLTFATDIDSLAIQDPNAHLGHCWILRCPDICIKPSSPSCVDASALSSSRVSSARPITPRRCGETSTPSFPILDLGRALANPAWAALTAALHARGPHARAAAEIVIQACDSLPAEDRRCYLRLVFAGLEKDIVNAIKPSIPESVKWELTEYERQGGWFQNGLEEGRAEGLEEGREEGLIEGQRKALFVAIESRGFALTQEQRGTIEACDDEQQLDRWLRRLFHVDTPEALLADPE